MTRISEMKNRAEVEARIAEMLKEHEGVRSQEDIYLYVDEDGTGRVETFWNPGGSSYYRDDHVAVYAMKEDYDDEAEKLLLWWESAEELAKFLGVDAPKVDEDGDEINLADWLTEHIRNGEIDIDKAWKFYLEETTGDFEDMAERIVDRWIEEEEEAERWAAE